MIGYQRHLLAIPGNKCCQGVIKLQQGRPFFGVSDFHFLYVFGKIVAQIYMKKFKMA